MNTYCFYYDGNKIGSFRSKVPYVSAKKVCRVILKNSHLNKVELFTIINKETNQIYTYEGYRENINSILTFKNGTTIRIKHKYHIKRIY